jgi:hypothetical protein
MEKDTARRGNTEALENLRIEQWKKCHFLQ